MDHDGRLDLLQLSVNDTERLVPDHRGWHNVGEVSARQWPLDLTLPGGDPLSLGTRLKATAPGPWLQVVRDEGPLYVPDRVAGQVLVVTPGGRIMTAELGPGLTSARSLVLEDAELPPLLGPGGRAVVPGQALPAAPRLAFHAEGDGWGVEVWSVHRPADLVLRRDGEELRLSRPGLQGHTLGCGWNGRCRLLRAEPEGGYVVFEVDPLSGEERVLDEPGDMLRAYARGAGRLWTASSASIWERDPHSYAALHPERRPTPRLDCDGLAFDGRDLACASAVSAALVAYEPDTSRARWRLDLALPQGRDVLAIPGGWLVALADGIAWVDRDGSLSGDISLGGPPRLVLGAGGVWAILAHRALWLDVEERRVVGGHVLPNAGRALLAPPGGESGI